MARSSDLPFPFSIIADRSFQAREIRRVIALATLYLGITTVLVGVFYSRLLDSLLEGVAPLLFVSEDAQLTANAIPALGEVLGRWLLAMLAINVVVTLALGVFVTRRLGQPILALKRALREVGAGNLDVRLRASDKDEFGEIVSELAVALHSVREQVAAAKSGIELADSAETTEDPESRERALADCRTALDWFQVDHRPGHATDTGAA